MRILLLTHYWEPEVGAPQRRWQQLAGGLVGRGHELAVLAPAPHYPGGRLLDGSARYAPGAVHRDPSGVMVHRTAFRPYGEGLGGRGADQAVASAHALGLGLARFSGRHRPDVIVGSVPGLPTLPTALTLGALLRRPVVAELRDAWPDILSSARHWDRDRKQAEALPGAGLRRVVAAGARGGVPPVVTWLERQAAAVVTTTDAFAGLLRQRGVLRAVTVRNTAATAAPALSEVPRARPDGLLHVLYLGTVGRAQGLVSAVRAAARAKEAGAPMVLRVVGDGAEMALVRSEVERLGAPVELVPLVPRDEVWSHYGWADSVLVSLRDWPAMELTVPSKLYEVMGVDRHVSAAVAGEAAQVVRESACGDVVSPQDPAALARLWAGLARDRARLRVSGGGSWLGRNADPEAMVSRYERLLLEVSRG